MDGSRTPRISYDPDNNDLLIDERDGIAAARQESDDGEHFSNLAEFIDKSSLDAICVSLTERISEDALGQQEFIELMADHVKMLGVGPESEPDDLEYENSDTSDSPLLLTAMTRFQSKATAAILPQPKQACRAEHTEDLKKIKDLKARQRRKTELFAVEERVQDYYTDYLFNRSQTYQADTDRIIWESGLHGIGVRKIYNDLSRKFNKTRIEWVPIQNMIFSYTSNRVSQKIHMPTSDLIRMIQSGQYVADDLVTQSTDELGDDALSEEQDRVSGLRPSGGVGATHLIYETYVDLFIDSDAHPEGLARPYVVTIHAASQRIVSIRRNWQERDQEERQIQTYVPYIYSPGKTSKQGLGLGHILGNITRTLRRGQRRGFDSAYLQNMPFGYKLSNLSIRNESAKVVPGSFIDVDSPTDDIRSAIMMNMFQGPSAGLIQLLDRLESSGEKLGGIATLDFTQLMKSGVPVAPALAALEESTEFQTSVHRRLYDAQAEEMKLLHDRMQEVHGGNPVVYADGRILDKGDLTSVDLVPMMKPGFVSKQKSMIEGAALMEASRNAPGVLNDRAVTEEYVRSMGRSDIDDFLIPPPEDAPPPEPKDPLTEYTMILQQQPVGAGLSQNHQAHIDAHNAQMRMVEVSGMALADGERAMAALAAHIVDHHAQMMLVDIATRIGVDPTMFQNGIPPEMEGKISVAIAQATQEVEAERKPPQAQNESKIAIEQVKAQARMQETTTKQRHDREMADLKHKHSLELQSQKDEAETERANNDDDMALEIARMKDPNRAAASAGTKAS